MPLALVPMSAADYLAWWDIIVPEFAADKVVNGSWTPAESLQRSLDSMHGLLPQGQSTPGQFLYALVLTETGLTVGYLWLGSRDGQGYLYDLYVYPEFRRRGHARQAMQALESEARKQGFSSIALHVFGGNQAAADLYRSVGYAVTDLNLRKAL